MRAKERAAPAASPSSAPPVPLRDHFPGLLLICTAGGLLAFFFLALYAVKHFGQPIGWDTPRYLDQTNLVASGGLSGVPHHLPPPGKTLASRAGFPVVMLSLASLFGTSTFKVAAVVPPAAAAASALAAGAFVSYSLRRPAWEAATVALIVGISPVLIRLMAPETYTDNLFAAAIVMAALVPVLGVVRDGRGFVAAVVLLGAAGLAHGPFFALSVTALGIVAILYAPGSWRTWRRGQRSLWRTPSVRLGVIVAGGVGLTVVGILGFLRTGPDAPYLSIRELRKKLREDLPLYRFWLTIPLAAVGAADVARRGFTADRTDDDAEEEGSNAADEERERWRFGARFMLAVFAAWTLVCMMGIVAYLLGRTSPAHRFLAFMIPLPVLVALGVLALGRVVRLRGSRAAGALVIAAGLGALAFVGYRDLYVDIAGPRRGVEWILTAKVKDAATAAAYLESAKVPVKAPVVFVVDDVGSNPLSYDPEMAYMLRSVLPADRIEHAYFYVGDPANYLAGRPTTRTSPPTYNENMMKFWPTIQRLLPRRPTALLLGAYNPAYPTIAAAHPDWVVAPDVIALGGAPRPATAVAPPTVPSGPRGPLEGGALAVGTLVVLSLIGLGWALALLPTGTRSFEALALSPAFGIAFLILSGVLVDAFGIRLRGAGGVLAIAIALASGAALCVRRLRRSGPGLFSPR